MTLLELLKTLPSETRVGIWDIDRDNTGPLPQHYQALTKLPFAKIRNLLDREVMQTIPNDPGILIKVYDKDRLQRRTMAMEIAEEIKRRTQS